MNEISFKNKKEEEKQNGVSNIAEVWKNYKSRRKNCVEWNEPQKKSFYYATKKKEKNKIKEKRIKMENYFFINRF